MAKPALAPVPADAASLTPLEQLQAAAALVPPELLPVWQKVYFAARACQLTVAQSIERANQALV